MEQLFFGGLQTLPSSLQKATTTPASPQPSISPSLRAAMETTAPRNSLLCPGSPHNCKKTLELNKILAVSLPCPPWPQSGIQLSVPAGSSVFTQQSSLFPNVLSLSINQAPDLDSHSQENSQDDSTQINHRRVGMSEKE